MRGPSFLPRKLLEITAAYEAFVAGGFPVVLEGNDETLQAARDVDRTNWLTVYGICVEGIAAGYGDEPGQIFLQTTSNRRYLMTFNAAATIIRDLRAWGIAAWSNWNLLKDQARAATSDDELNAIDVTAGYP